MNTRKHSDELLSLLLACSMFPWASAHAEDLEALLSPNVSEATLKLPYMDKVNPLYRQYNGVNRDGIGANIDLDVVKRGNEGEWFKLQARNLGLATQEVGISYDKQGKWSIGIEYNQIPRYAPYEVRTAIGGFGTTSITQPSYPSPAGQYFDANGKFITDPTTQDVTLKTQRDIVTLTGSRFLSEGMKLWFSLKNEDKTGTRLSGARGSTATAPINNTKNIYAGFLFAPEPIDQSHTQLEAAFDWETPKYQLSGGFYGSLLSTKNNALYVTGGTNTALNAASMSPIALPPDNMLGQLYLNGGYNFSGDTRGTLKLSHSEGKQTDRFIPRPGGDTPLAGVGSDLNGKVRSTEAYASLTSRVTKALRIAASWRYLDMTDKTPLRLTKSGVTDCLTPGNCNSPESQTAHWGKLDADYNLGNGYSLAAGVDSTQKKSEEWARRKTDDLTSRLAFRKLMSDSVSGTLTLAHSNRTGSAWLAAPTIYSVYLADRKRDTVRGMIDWSPTEKANVQLTYEHYSDRYQKSIYGLESGKGQIASIDGSYAINDMWKLNGWYSAQTGDSKQYMLGGACSTGNNNTCTLNTYTKRTAPVDFTQWFPWNATLSQIGRAS